MKNYDKKSIEIDNKLADKISAASIDYSSTLWEESLNSQEEAEIFIKNTLKKKRRSATNKLIKSVAVVMLILVTGVVSSIWFQIDGVYGGKQLISKCIDIVTPLEIEEEINDEGDITKIITINEEDDIVLAKEQLGSFKVAQYVPDGYEFDYLTIRDSLERTRLEYTYDRDGKLLLVIFEYEKGTPDIMVVGELYKSPKTGQEMYIDTIEETGEYSVIEITDTYDCYVMGTGDANEGIKIVESINDF